MSWRPWFVRLAAIASLGTLFFLWHSTLLSPAGRIRGLDNDGAILALMGRKMLEGRGFDIFFWGQNYIGPFTSMVIAAFGADPLGIRQATFTLIFGGIVLTWLAVRQIDERAAFLAAIALAVGPPLFLRMMINPLAGETAFFLSSALLLILMPMVDRRSTSKTLQFVLGLVAGIGWWMNQQVIFTIMAGAIVLFARSRTFANARQRLRWHHSPVLYAGVLLFAAFVVLDVMGIMMPFLFGRATDWLLLIFVPLVFHQLRDWRRWRGIVDRGEIPAVLRSAAGAIVGYAPVWLGGILGWYERSYVFGFQSDFPGGMWWTLRGFRRPATEWIGIADGPIGLLFALAFLALVAIGVHNARTPPRLLIALIPIGNFVFHVAAQGSRPRYLISSTGALFALAALGACDLWDSRRRTFRVLVPAAGVLALLSIGAKAKTIHDDLLLQPDPMPLFARVHAKNCAVCYTVPSIAYRSRLLDNERCGWLPYHEQDRTPAETARIERLAGPRCLVSENEILLIPPPVRSAGRVPPGRDRATR